MLTIHISHAFQEKVMERYMENNLATYRLVCLNISRRDHSAFLYDLVEDSSEDIKRLNATCSMDGLMSMNEGSLADVKTKFENDPSSVYLIYYDYDYNTFKLAGWKKEVKIEFKDWLGDVVCLYSSVCQLSVNKKPVDLSFGKYLLTKKLLIVNQLADGFGFETDGEKVTVTDSSLKDNIALLQEIKRSYLKKETRIQLRDIFVFNIDYVTKSIPSDEQTQVIDFVNIEKHMTDLLMFVNIDDLIASHCSVLEHFLTTAIKTTKDRTKPLLCQNVDDRFIANAEQNEITPSSFGYYAKTLNKFHPDKLRNVHFGALSLVPGRKYIVDPNYVYFHYNQDNFKDDGWGCAYRSLQTIISWFVLNGQAKVEIPSIPQIQKLLFEMGDKPANFVGSNEWIGSTEVSYVIQKLIGVDSQIMFFQSGLEIPNYLPALQQHFETRKTPIMIGGSVLAYTLLGISFDEDQPQNSQFLILDPHYKGKEDMKTFLNPKSKAVYWSKSSLFKANAFYNFCCPIPK
jgi:hypothetical protein